MSEKILIPLDGSEIIRETHCYIKELGVNTKSECVLLHVLPDGSGQEATSEAEALKHPLLKEHHSALSAEGLQVTSMLRTGDPVEEIAKLAMQLPASMILMSTHGRTGLDNIRQGSVTEQIVRQSPCPVFVLHSTRSDTSEARCDNLFRRMLVPLDGTEVSASILPCVEKLAGLFKTEVVLFHDDLEHDDSQTVKQHREVIEEHGVALANAGVSVKLDYATHARPVSEILERTKELDIDLVAMATHGDGGSRRPLEESVTANVMRYANRPLIVCSSDPQCPVVC